MEEEPRGEGLFLKVSLPENNTRILLNKIENCTMLATTIFYQSIIDRYYYYYYYYYYISY